MLKVSRKDHYADHRKSVYRTVRPPPRIEHRESWQCISCDYPVVKIVNACTIFDFIRSSCDTTFLIILLFYTLDLEYIDVMLVKPDPIDEYDNEGGSKNEARYVSINRGERTRIFNHEKEIFCIILGIASVIVVAEIPLAIILFKAVQKQEKRHLIYWTQTSLVFIFFNFVAFIAILVYASKAGLILDNETWVSENGINLRFLFYMNLLRTAIFDVTKGAEVVLVNAIARDVVKRKKVIMKDPNEGERV